jgi:hypothetical protein
MSNAIKTITHADLVKRAECYLRNCLGCNPLFCERGSARNVEMPDAIGWNQQCIVIECKASKEDLAADAKKPFRMRMNLFNQSKSEGSKLRA